MNKYISKGELDVAGYGSGNYLKQDEKNIHFWPINILIRSHLQSTKQLLEASKKVVIFMVIFSE